MSITKITLTRRFYVQKTRKRSKSTQTKSVCLKLSTIVKPATFGIPFTRNLNPKGKKPANCLCWWKNEQNNIHNTPKVQIKIQYKAQFKRQFKLQFKLQLFFDFISSFFHFFTFSLLHSFLFFFFLYLRISE